MKIKPIASIARSFDRDERQDAEERRYALIFRLLSEMNVPSYHRDALMNPEKRESTLRWLGRNLGIYNSHHEDYKRAQNLIVLALKKKG